MEMDIDSLTAGLARILLNKGDTYAAPARTERVELQESWSWGTSHGIDSTRCAPRSKRPRGAGRPVPAAQRARRSAPAPRRRPHRAPRPGPMAALLSGRRAPPPRCWEAGRLQPGAPSVRVCDPRLPRERSATGFALALHALSCPAAERLNLGRGAVAVQGLGASGVLGCVDERRRTGQGRELCPAGALTATRAQVPGRLVPAVRRRPGVPGGHRLRPPHVQRQGRRAR
jgi:hypothetical protein